MASFRIFHKILFNIFLELDGYKEDVTHYVCLQPDKRTNELLSQHRILLRKQKNCYVALIEVNAEGVDADKPAFGLKQNETFRFHIKVNDIGFFSRTHLDQYDFRNNILMLSNEVDHVEGSEMLLSKHIRHYSNGQDYEVGYVVRSGGSFYSARRQSSAVDAHPVTDEDYWKNIANGSFVSQADLQTRPSDIDLSTFMIIDIKHSNTLPSSYQLLDTSSKCKEVSFKIKLLNK
jgi:hypothetical protein